MVDHDMLYRELADLAAALHQDSDLYEGLHRLTITTATALEVEGAGVTLQVPGRETSYVTAADPVTLHVEHRQDELQEGACVDAIRTSQIVAVGDLTAERPWPQFTPVLLEAGFTAAAGVPIRFQGLNIGAVNLYDNHSRAWTTEDFNAARLVANMAAGYLINNELLRTTQTLAEQLQLALNHRVIIEQAKGVMAGRHGVDPEAAFESMRSYARSHRTKLRDVARDVINGSIDLIAAPQDDEHGTTTPAP